MNGGGRIKLCDILKANMWNCAVLVESMIFFSIFHIHPLYCIDDDHFHCKLQIGFHPSIRIRVISFRFLLFAATIVQTLVCNRSLLEILYMSNTHQQISMEDVVLYETNREALSALCSVVKHAGSVLSTKV